jgi:glycerol-3-phosphate dehydrogenase
MIERLRRETFDVVVIGGGITGAGVALDAATRGLRTALVERDDFASGTSSKSSKLVHGGLRYLQQGEIRLVYEALRERQRLRTNAPHLVALLPFMIPILVKDGPVPKKLARALGWAMWMYDLTGGFRIGKLHRRIDRAAALAHMPTMPADRVRYAYLYYDAEADDARLCLTVARTAAAHGAAVANGAAAVGLRRDATGLHHVTVEADGARFEVRARTVVNAAGVWSDRVRALLDGVDPDSMRPAKGIHVTVPWEKVRNDVAVVIPVPKDRRSLFVVPWGRRSDGGFLHAYVGTTDTDYDGPLEDPTCTAEDVDYVLRALNASITTVVTPGDVTGVWAGLRPLVKSSTEGGRTADLSRRHRVEVADDGLVSVFGGKLTTYREMAEDTVDAVCRLLGTRSRCRTRRLRLLGAPRRRSRTRATAPDLIGTPNHLMGRYGTDAAIVEALVAEDPSLGSPLVPGLPYVRAEAIVAVRHEMARTLDDVLSRRTRARLHDRRATLIAAEDVARLVAPELGWDDAEIARQVEAFRASVSEEVSL